LFKSTKTAGTTRWSGRRGRALIAAAATIAIPLGSMLHTTTQAGAAVGTGEDRQKSTPTGWWSYNGVDAAYVSSKLNANGARLTDLRVEPGTSPQKFTVTMVKNAGAYANGYWWYYGLTAAQVNSYLSANHARLIEMQGYNTAAGIRFAVIMIPNSGSNAEASGWYYGTPSFIASKVNSSNRMVSFGRIQGTSYYTAVFGSNTGTDNTGWWWYYGMSTAQIGSIANANHARIVDLDRNNDNGTYNVLMYSNPTGTGWWWYVGASHAALVEKANQNGARLIDVTQYNSGATRLFAGVMVDNSNALSQTLRGIIAPKVDSGRYGFYLKQVNGSVLANLQSTRQYEPASALKVLYHAKTIHEQSLGNKTDSTMVTYHFNPADPTNKDICPDNYANTATTNLKDADQKMMWNSDNRMTRAILELYGKPSMLAYASSLGLTATQINHNIGCGTPHNYTTLTDLGKIYEGFQTGKVTTNATWQANFRSRMLNQANTGYKSGFCPIVQQEATKLGKSSTVATNFCNTLTWIAKGGSYGYGDGTVSWDGVSLTGLPFKSSGVVSPRFYVFGQFIDGTHIDSDAEKTAVTTAQGKLYQEALRPYVRSALTTW